jgi:phenylacetate-CoA ligase
VFDWYGVSEHVANIVQCERGNYHIRPEYGVVEILNRDGTPTPDGDTGELVCTGLNNTAMPFIRYRVGDTAVPKAGSCPCQRGGQLVEHITGRTEDVVICPDGRYVSWMGYVLKGINHVEEAQIIQEEPGHVRVRLVPRPDYTDQDTAQLLANMREQVGNDMRIEIQPVEAIPRAASGKFRLVISKVPLDLAEARQTGEMLGVASEEERTL